MKLSNAVFILYLCLLLLEFNHLQAQTLQVSLSSDTKVNRTTKGGTATIFFDSSIKDLNIVCTEENPNESIIKINDHQWFVNIEVNKDIETDGVCYRNYLLKCSASAEYCLTTDAISPNQVLYYTITLPNELEPQLLKLRGRTVSEKALRQLQDGNSVLAANIMLELLPSKEKNIPYLPEYEEILFSIYDSLMTSQWYPITIKGHLGEIMSSAFSDDGSLLVTGSNDKSARVWDMRTGMEHSNLRMMHSTSVENVAVSQNKKNVVTQTLYSDSLYLWSLGNNGIQPYFIGIGESPFFIGNDKVGYKHVKKHEKYNLLQVDGLSIYNIVNDKTDSIVGYHSVYISKDMKNKVMLTEVPDNEKYNNIGFFMEIVCPKGNEIFQIPDIHIIEAKFSPNNKYFAIRSNNRLDIIDLTTLSVCKTLEDSDLFDYVFSNDDEYIIFCCLNKENNIVRIWDINKGELINRIQLPWEVTSLSISNKGLLFVGGRNGQGKFWKYDCPYDSQNNLLPLLDCGNIRFFKNGDAFLIKEDKIEKEIADRKYSLFCKIEVCGTEIFNNDKIVAVSTYDVSYKDTSSEYGSYITQIHNKDGKLLFFIPNETLALAANNPWIITGEKEIYDYKNNHIVMSLKGHYNNLTCGGFMYNDSIAVTGSYDHTVRFWDVKLESELLERRITLDNSVYDILINEDNGYIFISDDENLIHICNLEYGNIIKSIKLPGNLIYMQYDEAESILKCLVERSHVYPEWNAICDIFQYKIPSICDIVEELHKYRYNLSAEERVKYNLE